MSYRIFKFLVLVLVFISLYVHAYSQHEIVLSTDFGGEVLSGSKAELISEIRKGKSVRIGWQLDFDEDGKGDFDHWAPAEFITILDGEVFTQIRNINLQVPKIDIPQVDIIPVNTMWTAILGTNGELVNRFVFEDLEYEFDKDGQPIVDEKMENELAQREVMSWKVATFWAVEK